MLLVTIILIYLSYLGKKTSIKLFTSKKLYPLDECNKKGIEINSKLSLGKKDKNKELLYLWSSNTKLSNTNTNKNELINKSSTITLKPSLGKKNSIILINLKIKDKASKSIICEDELKFMVNDDNISVLN